MLTRCGQCGAFPARVGSAACELCGAALHGGRAAAPGAASLPASPPAANLGGVKSHPQYRSWLAQTPSGAVVVVQRAVGIVVGLGFCIVPATMGITSRDTPGPIALFLASFVLLGLGLAGVAAWKLARFLRAPLERRPAAVFDERTRLVRSKHGHHAHHYVTLEFERGARREYHAAGSLAGEVARGDVGLAFVRDDQLLDFRRAA